MDSAKSILHNIVLATQQVQNAIVRYSAFKGVRQVQQYSLIRLQFEFQTIADASHAILKVFDDPFLRRHYMLDDRFMDWLSGSEPEACLEALREMIKLLNIDHDSGQAFAGFAPTRSGCQEDVMNGAITLFYTRKSHFHYLLTTSVWNYEEVLRQPASKANCTREVHMHGLEEVRTTLTTMEHKRKEIVSQKLKKLLKMIDPLNCSRKHRETSSIRQSDTCMWLPVTDEYRSWKEGKDSFLWLQGRAGSGKSVLASFVVNDLNDTKKDDEILIYFYCDFRSRRSTSAIEVMRSLLAELTEHLCGIMVNPEDLLDELLKVAINVVDPFYNVRGLSHYLSKVARLCPGKPLVVVDGLDECKEVETLLDGLIMCGGDVRIFVTTRPLKKVIKRLAHFPCISLDKMTNELSADILLHVTRELDSRHRLRTFGGSLREEIRSTLCAKADGMFRWVQCQIDTLDKCTSIWEIRRVLENLPEGLEETYRRILIAIDKRWEYSRLVRRGLVWLVTALRPMRLRELLEALTIDPERRALDPGFLLVEGVDFLEVSRSLVIHHEETDIVTLSHMSVKEYLVGELIQEKLPQYHIVLGYAHERSARLCMAYIAFCLDLMKEYRNIPSSMARERDLKLATSYGSRPFLGYVLSYGFSHLAHLESANATIFTDMETLQREICRYAPEWDRMCKLAPSIRSGIPWANSEHDFMIYTLVAFASDALFHAFLGRSTTLTPREGTNPLVYAARFGKTEHVKALISRGARVNDRGLVVDKSAAEKDIYLDGSNGDDSDSEAMIVEFSNERRAMPIQVAVDHWHAEMFDLLLSEGSTISDELLNRVLRVQPHQFPSYIIRRLLQTTEFVKFATAPWDKRQLLEAFVEDETDDSRGQDRDELMLATRTLAQVGCAETLFLIAVAKGCIPVIKTLLLMHALFPSDTPSTLHPRGIANLLAANGDTPLHIAMKLSDENQCLLIAKLLVEAGCGPCELDADDRPPIQIVVGQGFVSVVEYLISLNVPLPSRIVFAASQAPFVKRADMIRFLVSKGAKVHLLNPSGDGLLHVAMRSLYPSLCLEIASILIDAGCDPLTPNLIGETPLQMAAKQGYYEVVNYLILFISSSDVLSLLHRDSATQLAMLQSFIGNMDGLQFHPEEEDMILEAVRRFIDEDKCLESAKIFIDSAGDLFVRSPGSRIFFDIAVRQGFCKVVEYLTSQSVSSPPEILFTALQCRVSMIPCLIRSGADVHVQKDNGDTLLHVTMSTLLETECCSTTRVLVEAGCNPFALDATRKRPIDIAVSRGFFFVVEYLVSSRAYGVEASLPADLLLTAIQNRQEHSMDRFIGCDRAEMPYFASSEDDVLRSNGVKVLNLAVMRRLPSIVDYLLSKDVSLPSDILLFALPSGPLMDIPREDAGKLISIISSLIGRGANVHVQDDRNTLLHNVMWVESESHCLEATKILMEADCSASIPNADGKLPIEVAATRKLFSVVEFLLSRDAPFPSNILIYTLQPLMMFDTEDTDNLMSIVSSLIRKGADVHVQEDQNTLLHSVMWMDTESLCLEATTFLVEAGCSASVRNSDGKLPIELAVTHELFSVVEFLLSRDAPFPSDILICALRPATQAAFDAEDADRLMSMVSSLVRKGADIHVQDGRNTLLHSVMWMKSESHCLKATNILMEAGCSASVRNLAGKLPIEVAVTYRLYSVVEFLLSRHAPFPADILFVLLDGPIAFSRKARRVMSLFIEHGADVCAIAPSGDPVLHVLLTYGFTQAVVGDDARVLLKLVDTLVQAGCDTHARDRMGRTPLEIAEVRGHLNVVEYLQRWHSSLLSVE